MKQSKLYLSTIDPNAHTLAIRYGLGLEIAEYCTAYNMDEFFTQTDTALHKKLDPIPNRTFHAPFNELFPCAIDPLARALARQRYRQAVRLAQRYGAEKVIIHGGYHPKMYYPCWYTEQSTPFWQDFLKELPAGVQICLENVLEEEPPMLLDILNAVNDPRLSLCLDIGHSHVYSEISVMQWLEICAPYISHFHIHNNPGTFDMHCALPDGTIPMEKLLESAAQCCPDATYTLEVSDAESSVRWLLDRGLLEE